jgi:mutual gliding-motility protein MglA
MFINNATNEVNCKIVVYGMALSGKTTNVEKVHELLPSHLLKSNLTKLDTLTERTVYFDFMSAEAGSIGKYSVRSHIYTIPGQAQHRASRQSILRGVDGVVLVADSQREVWDFNLDALNELQEFLTEYGVDLKDLPFVVQLNKRDLPNIVPVEEMTAALQINDCPVIEASAINGEGVMETMRTLTQMVIKDLKEKQAQVLV